MLSILNGFWFAIIYCGSEWVTAHRATRVRIDLPGELSIPLIPAMVLPYMSIYVLFWAGPFVVRERRRFAELVGALAIATFIGGIGFLLFPATAAYAPAQDLGIWAPLLAFADRLNLNYNMLPSLHVALSVSCIAAFSRNQSRLIRTLLWTWAGTIAISTVLTHQHHVLDAVSGWIVGVVALRLAGRVFAFGTSTSIARPPGQERGI